MAPEWWERAELALRERLGDEEVDAMSAVELDKAVLEEGLSWAE